MEHVKNFNESYNKNSNFDKQKLYILSELSNFMNKYDNFTKMVSSRNWRTTGMHFTQLRQMEKDIKRFIEITSNDIKYLNTLDND